VGVVLSPILVGGVVSAPSFRGQVPYFLGGQSLKRHDPVLRCRLSRVVRAASECHPELPEGYVVAIALAKALDLDFGGGLAARAYYS
jgi:hypothetical protein